MMNKHDWQCDSCFYKAVCQYKSDFLQIQQMINTGGFYVCKDDGTFTNVKDLPNVKFIYMPCEYYDLEIMTVNSSNLVSLAGQEDDNEHKT